MITRKQKSIYIYIYIYSTDEIFLSIFISWLVDSVEEVFVDTEG
jgi:hypothetical protein